MHCGFEIHSPTRWHLTLSCRFPPLSPGTATRTRWQPAHCLCGPHRSLSSLSAAAGLPGLWHCHQETAPCQCRSLATGQSSFLSSPPPPLLASHPILWGDWERRFHRRELVKLLRLQRVDVRGAETSPSALPPPTRPLSRAQRAHWRLSWTQRLARNATASASPSVSITLFGIPDAFAEAIGLQTL